LKADDSKETRMRHLVFQVSGTPRVVSRRLWYKLEGPLPGTDFPCDGCSNSPDFWGEYLLWPACVIHDYHYREEIFGTDWRARTKADAVFRRNMVTILRLQGCGRIRARRLAWFYWGRVRIWGQSAYRRGAGTEDALPWYKRFGEVWCGGRNRR
jgi:hypothetical protein